MRRAWSWLLAAAALGGCNAILGIDDPRHTTCGDGAISGDEACDDGNTRSGDGCSAACEIERGFRCEHEPSACEPICGDGRVVGHEECDDGDTKPGDGCSVACRIEPGFGCTGEPSACARLCGDGAVEAPETCDDGNTQAGDGCDPSCRVEPGFTCAGEPSSCQPVCGDGQRVGGEACDDDNRDSGDGCSDQCQIEHGYTCSGTPSVCASACGDGLVAGDEQCDDGGIQVGDGCSPTCQVEHGYTCAGEPSKCVTACGDGKIAPDEQCDDGNQVNGDGCNAACQVEPGFLCDGAEPTSCAPICGDGLVVKGEACDDGNLKAGDGCSAACAIEPGFACIGAPSSCAGICGDNLVVSGEGCDEGPVPGVCCTTACQLAPGCVVEVEPNDTTTLADVRASDPVPVKIIGSTKIKAAISPAGEADDFAMSLSPANSVVRIETFDGTGRDCAAGVDTKLTLLPSFGPALYIDADSGIGSCSAVVANLPSGSYYVRVESAAAASYLLEVKLQQANAESEPNDSPATATSINGTDSYMTGSHLVATDVDYFSFSILGLAPRSIRAEIIEGSTAETCESGGIASRLTLYKSTDLATPLADDDAGAGRGLCSLIDGTGSVPLTPGAHALVPGNYYLRVMKASTATGSAALFDYKLSLVIR